MSKHLIYIDKIITLYTEDIFDLDVDILVNPTDEHLSGNGGLDLLIQKRGGPLLRNICNDIKSLTTGSAIVTDGFQLKSKKIIHTAIPRWNPNSKDASYLLSACYVNCLDICQKEEAHSIAFVPMGTGAKGFPDKIASQIAINTIMQWLNHSDHTYPHIYFVFRSEEKKILFRNQIILHIVHAFKQITNPMFLAISLKQHLPVFFEADNYLVQLSAEKQKIYDEYDEAYSKIHFLYNEYSTILYTLIGKPFYDDVVNNYMERLGIVDYSVDNLISDFHVKQMTLQEGICLLVFFYRSDYWDERTGITQIRNCWNGNVLRILEHIEKLIL